MYYMQQLHDKLICTFRSKASLVFDNSHTIRINSYTSRPQSKFWIKTFPHNQHKFVYVLRFLMMKYNLKMFFSTCMLPILFHSHIAMHKKKPSTMLNLQRDWDQTKVRENKHDMSIQLINQSYQSYIYR